MPSPLDDLFRQQIASRMASTTDVQQNPLSKTPLILQSPDRYYASLATLDPADPATFDYGGQAFSGDNPGLAKLGLPAKDISFVNAQDSRNNPTIAPHEDIHQFLGDLANRLGMRYPSKIDPLIKGIQKERPDAQNYDEFPAYLFANPRELYNDPAKARDAQQKYLEVLRKSSAEKAQALQNMVIR